MADGGNITVKELCRRARITTNQANDYISRGLLLVAEREGRKRFLSDPPACDIVRDIKAYMSDHGNLNKCADHLQQRYPAYYKG